MQGAIETILFRYQLERWPKMGRVIIFKTVVLVPVREAEQSGLGAVVGGACCQLAVTMQLCDARAGNWDQVSRRKCWCP